MMKSENRKHFVAGMMGGLPFVPVIVPFALLFGVVATEAGFNVWQTMSMSFIVIAGASQFVAVQLLSDHAPLAIILASALAVNMRMAMYSAAMVPHMGKAPLWQKMLAAYLLVDQCYGVSINRFESPPEMTTQQKMTYFFGVAAGICPLWYVFTYVGAVAGTTIPPELALDFAVPITFLALVAPNLKTLAHVAAAVVSVVVALALVWLPYSLGLIVAALVAMLTGALVETWRDRGT